MSGAPIVVKDLKGRDEWMRQFLAVHQQFKRGDLAIAMRLALHLNFKTGQCNPKQDTLADEVGASRKTVQRGLDRIEAAGWCTRQMPGGQNNTEFTLKIPSAGWTSSVHPDAEPVTPSVTRTGWTKNGARVDIKRAQGGRLVSTQEQKNRQQKGRAPSARPTERAVSVERGKRIEQARAGGALHHPHGDDPYAGLTGEDDIPF